MTTPPIEDATDEDVDVPGARTPSLGSGVIQRLRLPGPGRDTTRPSPIGSVASSSTRFATGLARSVPSRQQLRGPQNADVQSIRTMNTAPPRWWSPDLVPPGADDAPAAPLPPRGLPRAVHTVPSEGNRTPGGILGSLVSTAVPVRRMDAVTAAGPMLTSHDQQKLSAVAVNRSIAQQSAATAAAAASAPAGPAAPASPAMPSLPSLPAMPPPRPAAAPAASTPNASAPAGPAPDSPPPAAPAPADPAGGDLGGTGGDAPVAQLAGTTPTPAPTPIPAAPSRPSFLPERRSRLASVRGPVIGAQRAAGAMTGSMTGGFPRSVGALALAGADPLTSPSTDTPAHIRPLPRMVGGGHAVAASANAGRAPVAAGDPLLFRAGRNAAEPTASVPASATVAPIGSAGAAAPNTPTAAAPSAVAPDVAPTAAAAATGPASSGVDVSEPGSAAAPVADGASPAAGVPDDVPAGAAAAGVAPGGGRGRRRANADAVGIGLATTRSLRPAARGGDDVRPSLRAASLPTMGAGMGTAIGASLAASSNAPSGAAAGPARAWLPGAEQRAAGARTSVPGALSLPGRTASLGMSDLLPSTRGLAAAGDSATANPLASAFGAADPITPAGSAASAAPAPPTTTAPADAGDTGDAADDDATGGSGSPLGAARRRARSRRAATTSAPGVASPVAGAAGAAAAAGVAGAASLPGGVLAPLKRLVDTTSGTAPATHMPAPPPVSLRGSAGTSVPPMSAAASLARGGDGGLKRSLIDVTAGMFDSMPASSETDPAGSSGPPIPASALSDIRGNPMAEVERRLQVVRDGDAAIAPPSLLDDPAAMDELVDEVVQRIEARVIDELERRGRRHNPGVF